MHTVYTHMLIHAYTKIHTYSMYTYSTYTSDINPKLNIISAMQLRRYDKDSNRYRKVTESTHLHLSP